MTRGCQDCFKSLGPALLSPGTASTWIHISSDDCPPHLSSSPKYTSTGKLFQNPATTTYYELQTRWSSARKAMMSSSTLWRRWRVSPSLIPRQLDHSPNLSFRLRAVNLVHHQPAQILVHVDKKLLHSSITESPATSDEPIIQLSGSRDHINLEHWLKPRRKTVSRIIPQRLLPSIPEPRSQVPLLLRMPTPEATQSFLACPSRHPNRSIHHKKTR